MIISKFKEKETEKKKKATWNISHCDAYNIKVFSTCSKGS